MAELGPAADEAGQAEPTRRRTITAEEREQASAAEDDAVERAFEQLALGQLGRAADLLQSHVKNASRSRTLTTVARIRALQGHPDEALEILGRAERLDPSDLKVPHFAASVLESLGRWHEAVYHRRRLAYSSADAPSAAFVNLIACIVNAAPNNQRAPLGELRAALDHLSRASDTEPAVLAEAARLLYRVKPLQDDAMCLYRTADPCSDRARDIVATWHALPAWCEAHKAPIHRNLQGGKAGRRPMVAELRDVIVHPQLQWLPIADEGRAIFRDIGARRHRTRGEVRSSPLLMYGSKSAVLRLPAVLPRVDRPAVLIGGTGHYFHDTIEHLGALCTIESLLGPTSLPLIVNADLAAHQSQLLELLGIGQERLIRVEPDEPVAFARLYVPSRPLVSGKWIDPAVPAWYRRCLTKHHAGAVAARKLYLSRDGTTTRRVVNEEDVSALLATMGFETIHPEMLSVRAQIELFSTATHIVGAAGAALTNMIYAAPGTRVLIFHNRQAVHAGADLYYDALGAACEHSVDVLDCEAAKLAAGISSIDGDLYVDLDRLRDRLT
jgi:capsular polysaccharide biosynthesis protein/tetratricopeptide (TPR) repeat protein